MTVNMPKRKDPPKNWEHYDLYKRCKEAIYALPVYFESETVISGIRATDIFTLNQVLGATIEDQVVRTLNGMRSVWDPDDEYVLYRFVRQPQTFPDVLLKRSGPKSGAGPTVILGIELKSWYLLAKEEEPSFRYTVTPKACNLQDLLVVVPWALSNAISGEPRVFQPFVESARFVAEYKNYWWQHIRRTSLDTKIVHPENATPYPDKSDQIADQPVSDSGGNFGRIARTGVMDDYVETMAVQPLCGIEAQHWRSFFKAFREQSTSDAIKQEIENSLKDLKVGDELDQLAIERVSTILDTLKEILTDQEK
jgi:hypothetical protein